MTRKGLRLIQTLLPVWGILPFCIWLLLIRLLFEARDGLVVSAVLFVATICGASIMLGILATIALLDDRIILNESGIRFPAPFIPSLRGRCERAWSDLKNVDVSAERTVLTIIFCSGGTALIDILELSDSDVDKLITFLEIWFNQTGALAASTSNVLSLSTVDDLVSYSDAWEQEMNRRFHTTNYAALEPGTLLCGGRVRILRQMSCGGFSAIYLAQNNGDELVVLKEAVLPAGVSEQARGKALQAFGREAEILTKLNHPGITQVFDYFIESDRHYLLLEYTRGEDLRQLVLRAGPQSEERVVEWASQVAEALEYLHSHSPAIVHRDLTPENLVLTKSGAVTLIDFGAANHFIGTATGTIVGKQGYISPEQFKGKAEPKSDVFAFGSTVYYLLTGLDPQPLSESNIAGERKDVSEELSGLILRCTQPDKELRPDIAELRVELAKMLARRARLLGYVK